MRLLVQTKGAYQLLEPETQKLIRSVGCTVVTKTAFVEGRAAMGQLIVMAQVGNAATDDEWLAYATACDGDLHLAVESFKAAFPIDEHDTLPTDPREAAVVREKRAAALIAATAVNTDGRPVKSKKS